ncbi:MAG: rhomboid family intramembrane serine protease [Candidatus Pelagadaptatus aseana]|uniref:rhomboid family intramembrane serine protease n=1 Tax=Candidatus Pelagadaptatus aseana TaxID=3120508 RepID=UPI0039B26B6A
MSWFRVKSFPLSKDLSGLLVHLQRHGVMCRVTEEKGNQCLWVAQQEQVEAVSQWLAKVEQAGIDDLHYTTDFQQEQVEVSNFFSRLGLKLLSGISHYPVTLLTIFLGICGFLLVEFDREYRAIGWFTMQPILLEGGRAYWGTLQDTLDRAEYWRLITPIFLHFGVLHAAFNSLWVWEFGRRIERFRSPVTLMSVVLITGIFSNLGQYYWSGPSLFGGLSGVLYGLMGFIWVIQMRNPNSPMRLPPGIIGFLLVWLVIGLTGAINLFIDGSIANAAHTVGLLSGMLLGLFWQDRDIKKLD